MTFRPLLAAAPWLALACLPALAQVNPDLSQWACTGACGSAAADGDITLAPTGNAQYAWLSTFGSTALDVSPLLIEESGGGGSTFFQTNGSSWLSPAFTLTAGQSVDAWFNYVSTDGKGFDDYAWARLVHAGSGDTAAWLFTARSTNGSRRNVVPGNALARATNNTVDFDVAEVIVNYADFDFQTRNLTIGDPIDWSPLGDSNGTCWRDDAEGCGFSDWLHAVVAPGAGAYRLEVGVVNFGDQIYDSGIAFDFTGLQPVPEPAGWLSMLGGAAWLAARRRQRR